MAIIRLKRRKECPKPTSELEICSVSLIRLIMLSLISTIPCWVTNSACLISSLSRCSFRLYQAISQCLATLNKTKTKCHLRDNHTHHNSFTHKLLSRHIPISMYSPHTKTSKLNTLKEILLQFISITINQLITASRIFESIDRI